MAEETQVKETVVGEQRKKSRVQYNLNYPVPEVRSNFDRDIKVMRAFVTASDFGQKFVGRKEVAPYADTNEQVVGGILTFFNRIGLADKEGYTYKPSLELINFENELKYETEEVAGETLKPIILKTWFGDMTIKIFRSEGKPLSQEDLFKRLGKMAGADPDYHRSAINHLIGYLKFSRLIEFNEDTKLYTINAEDMKVSKAKQEDKANAPEFTYSNESSASNSETTGCIPGQVEKKPVHGYTESINPSITFNINIEINNETNPELVKEIIQVLINELKG